MKNSKSGHSLTEVMISVALVVVIVGISTSSWLGLSKGASIVRQCSEMHQDMRHAFDVIAKDVVGSSEFLGGGDNWFSIMANRKGVATRIFYIYIPDAERFVQFVDTDITLMDNVTDFDYTLYEDDGVTPTTTVADAYSIDIKVTAEREVANDTFEDTFQTRLMLRNKPI